MGSRAVSPRRFAERNYPEQTGQAAPLEAWSGWPSFRGLSQLLYSLGNFGRSVATARLPQ
jgi:hypothetical protein